MLKDLLSYFNYVLFGGNKMFTGHILKKKKCDYIVDEILSMILSEKLKSGDRLPTENSIAESFDVSRITVREAFKELSLMGVVNVKQGEGTFISTGKPVAYMKQLLPLMVFTNKNANDLYDARCAIEKGTAALAAKNRTPAQLETLREILKSTKKLGDEKELNTLYASSVYEFHEYIVIISGNEFLLTIYTTINDLLKECISRTALSSELRTESFYEHEEIFKSIEEGNAEEAEKRMEYHIKQKKYFFSNIDNKKE